MPDMTNLIIEGHGTVTPPAGGTMTMTLTHQGRTTTVSAQLKFDEEDRLWEAVTAFDGTEKFESKDDVVEWLGEIAFERISSQKWTFPAPEGTPV